MTSKTQKTRPHRLESIQVMRGIAAFLVLIFHMDAMFREGAPRSKEVFAFWSRGFAGVDMFFVISGFIMVYVTQSFMPSIKAAVAFFYDRVTRIYPLWWLSAFIMMAYFYTAYGQVAAPDKASGSAVLPHIVKSLLLLPQEADPVLGVGWTLIHEMLFYILFAIGLIFSRKVLPLWLIVWAAIIIACGLTMDILPGRAKTMPQLFISPLNLEFIMGAFIALWMARSNVPGSGSNSLRVSTIIFGLGLVFFMIAMLSHVGGKGSEFTWKRVGTYGLPCAMMIMGIVGLERHGKLSFPKFLIRLGDWSYSLYLLHIIVLLSLKRIWIKISPYLPEALRWAQKGWLDNAAYIVTGILATIIVSALCYRLFEKPSLRILRRARK